MKWTLEALVFFFFHLWNRKLPEVRPQLLFLVKKKCLKFQKFHNSSKHS